MNLIKLNVVANLLGEYKHSLSVTVEIYGLFQLQTNLLTIFREDLATGCVEDSAGSVSRLRIYSDVLSANEVANLPNVAPVPFEFSPNVGLIIIGGAFGANFLRVKLKK